MRDDVILQKHQIQKFDTPVLFIIFNRPDNAKKVFDVIRSIKPTKLFIAADGPRYPIKNEYALCEETRHIICQVDWPCEVKTLFQDRNLGVGRGGAAGINWFFEHVEAGIILEDDCVPSEEFFQFCSQGLEQFCDDTSVMMLAGTSYHFGKHQELQGFYKSKHYAIWGWATWRRAWQLYSYQIPDWRCDFTYSDLKNFFGSALIAQRWAKIFDDIQMKRLEAWDAQWVFACIKQQAKSVCLTANMISNVGYHGGHANGNPSPYHEMPYQKVNAADCLRHEFSSIESNIFDMEVYERIGFLYKESAYKLAGRSLITQIPILKKIYEFIKRA